MRKRTYFIILSIPTILITLIILRCAILRNHPDFFSLYINHYDIDINSGDGRHQIYICSFRVKNQIHQTTFSQEVRRLGIPVSEKRIWKCFSTGTINIKSLDTPYVKTYNKNN